MDGEATDIVANLLEVGLGSKDAGEPGLLSGGSTIGGFIWFRLGGRKPSSLGWGPSPKAPGSAISSDPAGGVRGYPCRDEAPDLIEERLPAEEEWALDREFA